MEKVLPKGWVETELGEIAEWGSGGTPNRAIADYYNGTIPWIKTGDLNDGLITNSNEFITELGLQKSSAKIFPKGSVVLAMYGATIGKTGILDFDSSTNQACAVAKTFFNMNKFLFLFLKSEKETFIEKGKGGAQPNISQAVIKTHKIQLPPLAEQERIVAKLDALFAQHEVMKKALDRIPQLLKNFRQQVLTQAVTGKLTKEFKYINIVKEIQTDRQLWFDTETIFSQKTKTKKPQKIIVKSTNDKSYLIDKLSKKIDITFFEEISAKFNNALKAGPFGSSLKKEYYVESGYKVYGQEQVINDNPFYGNYYINEEKYIELKSCSVKKNDILVSLVGTIGKVLIIPEKHEKGIINPRLVKLSLHDLVNPKYIKIYLQSEIAKGFFKENSHGGTMDVLNLSIIKSLPIPLPSTVEQLEIVSRVELLFTKADAIEARYKNLKAKIESLPQALLHKAFKGELVQQLPTDGDAKDLLAEILALKKDVKGKKKS